MSGIKYDACLVGCVDGAYQNIFKKAAESIGCKINDIMPLPGCAQKLDMLKMTGQRWVKNFVTVSVAKHRISHIILCSHLSCGAYKSLGLDLPDEETLQKQHLERAKYFLEAQLPLSLHFYLKEHDPDINDIFKIKDVLSKKIKINSFIIKPKDMSQTVTDPDSQCIFEQVF